MPEPTAPAGATRPVEPRAAPTPGPLVMPLLLSATVLGTVSNNVLNVPLREITADFGGSVSSGVLVVSSFVLTLAAGLALSGWIGDRCGRRRTLVAALTLMALALLGAALAPSLGVLVAFRAIQGLACAAIPPAVMGLLSATFPPHRRAHTMGAWAAANGAGQALGPPFGGLVAQAWGWRGIFWVLAPITLAAAFAARHSLPDDRGRRVPLHWPGAVSLTAGSALVMAAVTAIPQHAVPLWATATLGAAGLVLLVVFLAVSRRVSAPFVRLRLIVEPRFARSALAAFTQMFSLTVILVTVPLYITGALGRTTAVTGLLVFALPAVMAVLAPAVASLCQRTRPRIVMRSGLLVLAVVDVAFGVLIDGGTRSLPGLVLLLAGAGIGVALVQTPSATGATQSPAGRSGAALGIFNMMRFAGSAFGAAWVAVVYPHGALLALFAGAAVVALLGLLASYAGPDPTTVADPAAITSA